MSELLPHAVIVTGQYGEDLGVYLAGKLKPNDQLVRVDEHLNPSKTSSGIYIEDIRDVQVAVRSSKQNTRTIVVLQDAAKMTQQSQNALLKLLEEPRDGLHLILCTYMPMQLLDTIRSRCQMVTVRPPVGTIKLPQDKAAQIKFMAGGVQPEISRLARDKKYFEQRLKLFELTKQFIGSSSYDRLIVVKQIGDKRDVALEFVGVALHMYTTLIKSHFSIKLRDEAGRLLEAEAAIRQNGNAKLQLLRFVVQ